MREFDVEANFYGDWVDMLRRALRDTGCPVPEQDHEVEFAYFSVMHRGISKTPRRLNEAKELRCPDTHAGHYAVLKEKIRSGADLWPHLSKNILKPNYHDALLNEWGIHHLHMGHEVPGGAFVEEAEGDRVLFAKFTDEDCYCIALLPHGIWAQKKLINSIYANWPELLEPLRLPDVSPSRESFSTRDREEARAHGITTLTSIGASVFAPLGGGFTRSRRAADILRLAAAYRSRVDAIEQNVRASVHRYAVWLWLEHRRMLPLDVRFRLEVQSDLSATAVCSEAELRIALGRL